MYILIVSRGCPSKKYKMNGIFEFDQAKALAKAGNKVVYAAIDLRSLRRKRKWGFEEFEKDGVSVQAINLPCGRIPRFLMDKMRIIAFSKLYEHIEKKYGKPDIIHAHFIHFGYSTACLFDKSKIPLILTEHYSGMNQIEIDPYLLKLGSYTYPRMHKVISVGKHLAINLKEKFGLEEIIIPNIVDVSSFKFRDVSKQSNDFNFISTGSLTKNKRMDILIKSFYNAFEVDNNKKLYIYGEGSERSNLEKIIRNYRLENNVFLMGLVDRKEIANKMCECDCFVLVSELETFGVAYIEAMAMGLPVIATRCGGPEDFVNIKNGLLVSVDNIAEITNSLISIYQNINHYNKKIISDLTINEFGSQTITNKLSKLYTKILNSRE